MSSSDYKRYKFYKFVSFAALAAVVVVVAGVLFGWLIMFLWNATIAEIFALSPISFWQGIGLFFLAKLFFGFGGGSSRFKAKDGKFRWVKYRDKSSKYKDFKQFWDDEGRAAYDQYRTKPDAEGA